MTGWPRALSPTTRPIKFRDDDGRHAIVQEGTDLKTLLAVRLVTFLVVSLEFQSPGFARVSAAAGNSAPTLTSLSAASPASASARVVPRTKLPTIEEWTKANGQKPKRVEKSQDELDLVSYREPDVQVLAEQPKYPCPEPRTAPTFDILFSPEGKVVAMSQLETGTCPPVVEVWRDAISAWRYRPRRFGEDQIPALFKVTVRFGGRTKPGEPAIKP